jgi:hypothetical protein
MDDKDLSFWESIIIDTTPGLQLSDREQWAYDVRKKIADCEYAGLSFLALRFCRLLYFFC